ncbi:MAG: HD-GYP domain-containing protein [Actinobacteria bacterium]|nr:HD-GYP domain-containing protein [Actinomycetota bacterium]
MRRLAVHSLLPGMKIARSIFNKNGQALLKAGTVLNGRFIERLKILGILSLYIEDGLIPDVEVNDVIQDETRAKAVSLVKNLIGEEGIDPRSVIRRSAMLSRDLMETVSEIIDQLMENSKTVVNLVDIRAYDEYTFAHSVNVCVLSLMTGISLGYSKKRLSALAMGTLMHDVGKILIPQEILNKPASLTTEEFEELKKHCYYGNKLLKSGNILGAMAASVALQHHERYNGQGYPRGLKNKEIHEFSRIAGIADTYDAITVDRVYRKAIPPKDAWGLVHRSKGTLFDNEMTDMFLSHIAAYPVGTIVRMSTNEVGAVIENIKGFSNLPRVRILFDPSGCFLPGSKEIWLKDEPDISIVDAVDDIESIFLNSKKVGNS